MGSCCCGEEKKDYHNIDKHHQNRTTKNGHDVLRQPLNGDSSASLGAQGRSHSSEDYGTSSCHQNNNNNGGGTRTSNPNNDHQNHNATLTSPFTSTSSKGMKRSESHQSNHSNGGGGGRQHHHVHSSSGNPSSADKHLRQYECIAYLGSGSFADVTLARHTESGRLYAIKRVSKRLVEERGFIAQTITERRLLGRLRHPFLVRLHEAFQNSYYLYMVLSFAPGGDFFYHLSFDDELAPPPPAGRQGGGKNNLCRSRRLPLSHIFFYAWEMVTVLGYLHSENCWYRDLKPENILLDREGHIMLTDFGVSKRINALGSERADTFVGTVQYMPPEVLLNRKQTAAVDWWALGCVLFEMVNGRRPFTGSETDICNAIVEEDVVINPETDFTLLPEDLDELVYDESEPAFHPVDSENGGMADSPTGNSGRFFAQSLGLGTSARFNSALQSQNEHSPLFLPPGEQQNDGQENSGSSGLKPNISNEDRAKEAMLMLKDLIKHLLTRDPTKRLGGRKCATKSVIQKRQASMMSNTSNTSATTVGSGGSGANGGNGSVSDAGATPLMLPDASWDEDAEDVLQHPFFTCPVLLNTLSFTTNDLPCECSMEVLRSLFVVRAVLPPFVPELEGDDDVSYFPDGKVVAPVNSSIATNMLYSPRASGLSTVSGATVKTTGGKKITGKNIHDKKKHNKRKEREQLAVDRSHHALLVDYMQDAGNCELHNFMSPKGTPHGSNAGGGGTPHSMKNSSTSTSRHHHDPHHHHSRFGSGGTGASNNSSFATMGASNGTPVTTPTVSNNPSLVKQGSNQYLSSIHGGNAPGTPTSPTPPRVPSHGRVDSLNGSVADVGTNSTTTPTTTYIPPHQHQQQQTPNKSITGAQQQPPLPNNGGGDTFFYDDGLDEAFGLAPPQPGGHARTLSKGYEDDRDDVLAQREGEEYAGQHYPNFTYQDSASNRLLSAD